MADHKTIENSRHYFRNCKAAFRLLQGALLSGKYCVSDAELAVLEAKFVQLENDYEKTHPKTYNEGDPSLNDVQLFFLTAIEQNRQVGSTTGTTPPLQQISKKVLIIDDQYLNSGWKEVFELIFGKNNVIGVEKFEDAIPKISVHIDNIFMVFVDLNLPSTMVRAKEKIGKEGFGLLKGISKSFSQIPLVAFSAYDSSVIAKKAFEDGAWDYFSKEPEGIEVKKYKSATEYFSELEKICTDYIAYDKEFSGYWTKIKKVERNLIRKVEKSFCDVIIKNLRVAYKYLVMDYAIRLNPSFLEIDKNEEVIFQSGKALETLCAYLLNTKSVIPEIIVEAGKNSFVNTTLGAKIKLIKKNRQLIGVDYQWGQDAYSLNQIRNDNTHQDQFYFVEVDATTGAEVFVPNPTFIIKGNSISSDASKEFFTKVIELIELGIYKLPNRS